MQKYAPQNGNRTADVGRFEKMTIKHAHRNSLVHMHRKQLCNGSEGILFVTWKRNKIGILWLRLDTIRVQSIVLNLNRWSLN